MPFVAVSTQNFEASEADDDFNLRETVLRGQLGALEVALTEVSRAVTEFIEQPRPGG